MKHLIFSAILGAVAFSAQSGAFAAESEYDKPAWLEQQPFEEWEVDYTDAFCGVTADPYIRLEYSTDTGGSCLQKTTQNDCFFQSYGIRWWQWYTYWPVPYDWDTPGTMTYSRSDGNGGYATTGGSPDYINEYCNVWVTTQIDPSHLKDHIRYANTPQKLHTGGKSSSTRQQLFSVYIDGLRILDPEWRHGIGDTTATVIDPWLFTINGAAPGSDGYVYFLLADNSTVDITPTVAYDYYIYDIYPTKHTLYVTANSQQLSRESTTTTEFCVGQKISLSPSFVPAVPGFQSYTAAQWSLGGTYVNDWTQASSSASKNYYVNSSKLTQSTTDAWWYQAGTGLRGYVGVNLQFQNGKTVNGAVGDGYFNVYAPSVTPDTLRAPCGKREFSFPYYKAHLSDPPFIASVTVLSRYAGVGNFAQLIQASITTDIPNLSRSTAGQSWLDNTYPYNNEDSTITANQLSAVTMTDDPEWSYMGDIDLSMNFTTYVIFKPLAGNPASNIWVTVGRIDNYQWTYTQHWGQMYTFCPTPVYSSDTSFPTWPNTFANP